MQAIDMFDFATFDTNPPVFLNLLTGQVVAVGLHHDPKESS